MADPRDIERMNYAYERFEDEWWHSHEHPKAHQRLDQERDRKWLALTLMVWEDPAKWIELTDVNDKVKAGTIQPSNVNAMRPLRRNRDRALGDVKLHQLHVSRTSADHNWGATNDNVEIWVVTDAQDVPSDYDPNYNPTGPGSQKPERLYRVIPPPPPATPAGATPVEQAMLENQKKLAILALPTYIHDMRQMYGALTGAV